MEEIYTQIKMEDDGVTSPPVKGVGGCVFDPKATTYLDVPGIKKTRATKDIPQAVVNEVVEVVRGNEEEAIFRRSSLILRSPTNTARPQRQEIAEEYSGVPRAGSLPEVGSLQPTVRLDRMEGPLKDQIRDRRASTPPEALRATADSVIFVEEPTLIREEGESSEASSTVFAPSKAVKRVRGSITEDEGSVTATEGRQRKKKPGRPRTTNIIDEIREKQRAREESKKQEWEEWEERRMADANLAIPPAANLPSIDEVVEELENQPTPDITSEVMQVVRTIEKVATTSRNLKGTYIRALRMAALKEHAGVNLLAHRTQEGSCGVTEEVTAVLRRKVRGLQLNKERMEKELEQAFLSRREAEKTQRENKELRRKVRRLEEELQDVKETCIGEMDGRAGRVTEEGGTSRRPRAPSPPAGVTVSACGDGGRGCPPPSAEVSQFPLLWEGRRVASIRVILSSNKWRGS